MKRLSNRALILLVIFIAVTSGRYLIGYAQKPEAETRKHKAAVVEKNGSVVLKAADSDKWVPVDINKVLGRGDVIRTEKDSQADLGFYILDRKNAILRIKGDTSLKTDISEEDSILNIGPGKLLFWVKDAGKDIKRFELRTRNGIIGLEGKGPIGILKFSKKEGVDETACWLKSIGGYVINLNSGKYRKLPPGSKFIVVKSKEISVEGVVASRELDDLTKEMDSFRSDYKEIKEKMEVSEIEETKMPALKRYSKDYRPGIYRTTVTATKGNYTVTPYDSRGPRGDETAVVVEGKSFSVVGLVKFRLYNPGRYRVLVSVLEGKVAVLPYDKGGFQHDKEVLLQKNEEIAVEGMIEMEDLIEDGILEIGKEGLGGELSPEIEKIMDEEVILQLREDVKNAQKDLHLSR